MRLISATVRHYRVHHELNVEFDDSRTLIGGANECGKSTLIEAIHRALFLKSKVMGDVQKNMVSSTSSGHPEVDVFFDSGGKKYQLNKRFTGPNGTTKLVEIGGPTIQGDEAETILAELLGVDAIGGGRGVEDRVKQQWSHLWVWQGLSGEDPTGHATRQRDSLIHRLQDAGGAAAMQSELDTSVAAYFSQAEEALGSEKRPKVGSDLERALSDATEAENKLLAASACVGKLQQAVRDHEESTAAIARSEIDARSIHEQLAAVNEKLTRLAQLQHQESLHEREVQSASERCAALEKIRAQIESLRKQLGKLETALAPRTAEVSRLLNAWNELRTHAENSVRAYEAACEATRSRRLRSELASAWVARFEKSARLEELSKKSSQVGNLERVLAELRQELAKLPDIDSARLRKLQKLEGELGSAQSALKAMAAGLDLISSDLPVVLSGTPLAQGETRILVEDSEITIGQNIRLRIRPGGGTSLAEARQNAHDAAQALRKALDSSSVATAAAANEILTQRTALSSRIKASESSLESLDAASLQTEIAEASAANAAAMSELERRAATVPDFAAPSGLAEARQVHAEAGKHFQNAETDERRAKSAREAEATKSAEAESSHQSARLEVERQTREVGDAKAQLRLLAETHGTDEAQHETLTEARSARTKVEEVLASVRSSIAGLQPDLLPADNARLQRALTGAERSRNDAETRRAVAQATLRSDGTDDPQATHALAQSQAESARAHLASVERKAKAIRLLNQLFLEEQRALSERFTRPLAEKITGYLQCLFGPGARVRVKLADNAFGGLEIIRPDRGGGATSFECLSGGAKEQVAAAMRLAMAEVLAADHNGCLPVVFDDAFAYSDPQRVQTLQRMLDLAASRGLQVIVLTCNPSDYTALGARLVAIP